MTVLSFLGQGGREEFVFLMVRRSLDSWGSGEGKGGFGFVERFSFSKARERGGLFVSWGLMVSSHGQSLRVKTVKTIKNWSNSYMRFVYYRFA